MQVNNSNLSDDLHRLAEGIVEAVEQSKAEGRITLQRQEYVLRPDYSLWYAGDPKLANFEVKNGPKRCGTGETFKTS